MRYIEISETAGRRYKAGVIPYYREADGTLRLAFAVSSDPMYGGPRPQICKGGSDPIDSSPLMTAMREGHEEIGLSPADVVSTKSIFDNVVQGETSVYRFLVYAAECAVRPELHPNDGEVASVVWWTIVEFLSNGRPDQRPVVEAFASIIRP